MERCNRCIHTMPQLEYCIAFHLVEAEQSFCRLFLIFLVYCTGSAPPYPPFLATSIGCSGPSVLHHGHIPVR